MQRRAFSLLLPALTSIVGVLSCAPGASPADGTVGPAEVPAVPPPAPPTPVHYLVLAPRAFADELEPLVALRKSQGLTVAVRAVEDVFAARSGGAPTAEALKAEIVAVAGATEPQSLRFVVLAGDPAGGPAPVPSFFSEISDWRPGGFEVRPHRTDHDYALFEGAAIAVGRLPARTEKEMSTDEVGRLVMDELKRLDKVAYVRFASVYRQFRDISEFMSELKDLLNAKD